MTLAGFERMSLAKGGRKLNATDGGSVSWWCADGYGQVSVSSNSIVSFVSCFRSWRQDSSVVRFLRIDPMVNGSNPPSARISLSVRRVASSL